MGTPCQRCAAWLPPVSGRRAGCAAAASCTAHAPAHSHSSASACTSTTPPSAVAATQAAAGASLCAPAARSALDASVPARVGAHTSLRTMQFPLLALLQMLHLWQHAQRRWCSPARAPCTDIGARCKPAC